MPNIWWVSVSGRISNIFNSNKDIPSDCLVLKHACIITSPIAAAIHLHPSLHPARARGSGVVGRPDSGQAVPFAPGTPQSGFRGRWGYCWKWSLMGVFGLWGDTIFWVFEQRLWNDQWYLEYRGSFLVFMRSFFACEGFRSGFRKRGGGVWKVF